MSKQPVFKVHGSGRNFAVLKDGVEVLGPFYDHRRAEEACDQLIKKSKMKKRKCLCCPTVFMSEGAHHRMCDRCRASVTDNGLCA